VDIACPVGAAVVRAATGGRIVYVGRYNTSAEVGGPGIVVSMIGDDGLGYLYAHMSSLDAQIEEGALIATRQSIGPSGNSGFEQTQITPHLHFEMVWGESKEALLQALRPPWHDLSCETLAFRVNPMPYLYQWFGEYLISEDAQAG
jgi:murein DD-endopeptidase MepM/ murein hydrolase activator NlpD